MSQAVRSQHLRQPLTRYEVHWRETLCAGAPVLPSCFSLRLTCLIAGGKTVLRSGLANPSLPASTSAAPTLSPRSLCAIILIFHICLLASTDATSTTTLLHGRLRVSEEAAESPLPPTVPVLEQGNFRASNAQSRTPSNQNAQNAMVQVIIFPT